MVFSPKGWSFGSGATLWDYALHITSILKTRQLSWLPQHPLLQQLNSDRSRDRSRAWWWKKVGKRGKNNATVCIFQNECSLTHIRKTRNEHKLSPNSGGHYLKRMSHHYKYKCNIEGQCLRKKIKSTGLWPGSRERWESHTNIILRYHSKLTKIPGDCITITNTL